MRTGANEYPHVNRYVSKLRAELPRIGIADEQFILDQTKAEIDQYTYWYSCLFFGDPCYAISIAANYANEEDYYSALSKVLNLDGMYPDDSTYVWCSEATFNRLPELIEYPVRDGVPYLLEYVFFDPNDKKITFTETYLWEGQIRLEMIDEQIQIVYNAIKSTNEISIKKE